MWRLFKWTLFLVIGILSLTTVVLGAARFASFTREVREGKDAAPAGGKFVHAADIDMYYQEWGPKEGAAVILIHSEGGWGQVWKETGENLGEKGFHVIAPDMPPFGYSQRPVDPLYSREDQAKRIIGLMNSLRIDKAILVGHSIGARAVAQVALQYPRRVKAIVFVDGALRFKKPGESSSVFLKALLAIGSIRNAIAAATLTNPAFTHTFLKMFVAEPASATEYWVSLYRTPLSVKGTTNAVGDWLPQLLIEEDASLSSASASYRNIQVPTLVIWGEMDKTESFAEGKYLASIIPGARIETFQYLGHLPPLENPAGFNVYLLDFVTSVK